LGPSGGILASFSVNSGVIGHRNGIMDDLGYLPTTKPPTFLSILISGAATSYVRLQSINQWVCCGSPNSPTSRAYRHFINHLDNTSHLHPDSTTTCCGQRVTPGSAFGPEPRWHIALDEFLKYRLLLANGTNDSISKKRDSILVRISPGTSLGSYANTRLKYQCHKPPLAGSRTSHSVLWGSRPVMASVTCWAGVMVSKPFSGLRGLTLALYTRCFLCSFSGLSKDGHWTTFGDQVSGQGMGCDGMA